MYNMIDIQAVSSIFEQDYKMTGTTFYDPQLRFMLLEMDEHSRCRVRSFVYVSNH